jgi:DNA-directed RNA polymerase subunit M/transcription elongation factor TFIIS
MSDHNERETDMQRLDEDQSMEMWLFLQEQHNITGYGGYRPLTERQHEDMLAYDVWLLSQDVEHALWLAAGCRSVCPKCERRSVTTTTVITYGHARSAHSECSTFYRCESCDWQAL